MTPQPDYPDFSNHFTIDEICWLGDEWFYICICVLRKWRKIFCFKVFANRDDLLRWVWDLGKRLGFFLSSIISQKMGG